MDSSIVGELLDDDGAAVARVLSSALALIVVAVLLVAVALPVVLTGGLRAAATTTGAPPSAATTASPSAGSTASGRIVAVARRYLGVPYVFGGTDPRIGLDCSGLVQLVFREVGLPLPRTAQLQFNATWRVPESQLQAGDLVFFARTYADPHDWITHVGIYVGGGLQINAPTEGQVVSVQPVFSGYWGAHYAGAGRVPGA